LCGSEVENEMHLFLDRAQQVVQCWKEYKLWHEVEHHHRQSGTFSNIIFSIFISLDEASCARFVAILWSIWHARSEYLWKRKPVVPTTICKLQLT
jgi:hypothetical protein